MPRTAMYNPYQTPIPKRRAAPIYSNPSRDSATKALSKASSIGPGSTSDKLKSIFSRQLARFIPFSDSIGLGEANPTDQAFDDIVMTPASISGAGKKALRAASKVKAKGSKTLNQVMDSEPALESQFPNTLIHPEPIDNPRFDPFESLTGDFGPTEATRVPSGRFPESFSNPQPWDSAVPKAPVTPTPVPNPFNRGKRTMDLPRVEGEGNFSNARSEPTFPRTNKTFDPPLPFTNVQPQPLPRKSSSAPASPSHRNPVVEGPSDFPEPMGRFEGGKRPQVGKDFQVPDFMSGEFDSFPRATLDDVGGLGGLDKPTRPYSRVPLGKTAPNPIFPPKIGKGMGSALQEKFRALDTFLRGNPGTREISDMMAAARTDTGIQAGGWKEVSRELKKEFPDKAIQERIVDAVETGIPLTDPRLEAARQKLITVLRDVGDTGVAENLVGKTAEGKLKPFKKLGDGTYFPHTYPEGFWEDTNNLINLLKKKHPNMPDEIALQLVEKAKANGGKMGTQAEIDSMINGLEHGAHVTGAQRERVANMEGYSRNFDVLDPYFDKMAKKIQRTKYFGPKDIAAGKGESYFADLLHKLPADTKEEVTRLLTPYFEREILPNTPGNTKLGKFEGAASTILHLGEILLSNPTQMAANVSRSKLKPLAKGAASIFNRQDRLKLGRESGASQSRNLTGLDTTGVNKVRDNFWKWFGGRASESANRTTSGVIGSSQAEEVLKDLLKNPSSKRNRARLEELVLDPADTILEAGKLTPHQLKRASARQAELTQGLAEHQDLPPSWERGPSMPAKNAITRFKKMAFVAPRLLGQSFRNYPIRTGTIGLAAHTAAGELSRRAKAAKRAGVNSLINGTNFKEENRKELDSTGTTIPEIAAYDFTNSFAAGLPTEAYKRFGKGWIGAARAFIPPSLNNFVIEPFVAAGDIYNARTGKKKLEEAGKYVAGKFPVVGNNISNALREGSVNEITKLRRQINSSPSIQDIRSMMNEIRKSRGLE